MIGLDTNVLLRYVLRDDPAQADRSLKGLAGFRLL
jgi:predicted nucleic-acid-binding protein